MQYKSTTEDISNDVKPTENQNDDSINAEQKHVTSSIPSDISIKTSLPEKKTSLFRISYFISGGDSRRTFGQGIPHGWHSLASHGTS